MTPENMALIAAVRTYLINVIAVAVAKGNGASDKEVSTAMDKIEKQEHAIVAQIEKIDGDE